MKNRLLPGPPGPNVDHETLTLQGLVQVVQVVQVENEIDIERKYRCIDMHGTHARMSRVKRICRFDPDHPDHLDQSLYFNGLRGPSGEKRLDRPGPDILSGTAVLRRHNAIPHGALSTGAAR
jgi:hypothetical protein